MESLDLQSLVNIAFGAITGIFGWFARTLYDMVDKLKQDLFLFREQVAKDYMPKSEINAIKDELLTAMRRIEDKLERR